MSKSKPFAEIEFWTHSCEDTMRESFVVLVEMGMTRENAEDFLMGLYGAVAGEFGS